GRGLRSSLRANGSRERAPDKGFAKRFIALHMKRMAITRLSSPRLTGRSSTAGRLGTIAGVCLYWVARSSRAMTTMIGSSNNSCSPAPEPFAVAEQDALRAGNAEFEAGGNPPRQFDEMRRGCRWTHFDGGLSE
ncbi:MAG: hypothetical protein JWR80_639, partial [Bradyrhizobium sp.]|nr:hypothetical protein [Bradyrhizobium sp.]